MLLDSGANGAVDLNRLTRRCFLDDTATPEMYRECFYEDYRDKDLLNSMSVFPADRPPLAEDIVLSPDVVPASFPFPVLDSVPMDSADLLSASSPRWITRVPDLCSLFLSDHPHSSDTHISSEDYTSGSAYVTFDFGLLTFRVIKDKRFFDEHRLHPYNSRVVDLPTLSPFAVAAVDLPPLLPDVVPANFPVPCS